MTTATVYDANYFGKKLRVQPKLIRKALRKSKKIRKPAAGWVFNAAQEQRVLAVVTDWLTKPTGWRKLPRGMKRQAKN